MRNEADNQTRLKLPQFSDLDRAAATLQSRVTRTPVQVRDELNKVLGCKVFLKCDHFQQGGSFKLRGASNAVAILRESGDLRDVATHSSGNHGAALALAARVDGRQATIVMPNDAVRSKMDAVEGFGGQLSLCEPGQANREAGLAELVKQGLVPIPPYDHADIIAGQGTAAIELLEDSDALDFLVAPLGGGGLISGCAIAAGHLAPQTRVIGAEPLGAADTLESLQRGERVTQWQPDTIADGLRAVVGELNFSVIRQRVDQVLIADDRDIESAMRLMLETTGLRIEPSSAVAVAVIRNHPELFADQRVGLIITGGNIDFERFPWMKP